MVFWNCQITCSFCYPPYPDGDHVILLLAAAVKWGNTAGFDKAIRGCSQENGGNRSDPGDRVGTGWI